MALLDAIVRGGEAMRLKSFLRQRAYRNYVSQHGIEISSFGFSAVILNLDIAWGLVKNN